MSNTNSSSSISMAASCLPYLCSLWIYQRVFLTVNWAVFIVSSCCDRHFCLLNLAHSLSLLGISSSLLPLSIHWPPFKFFLVATFVEVHFSCLNKLLYNCIDPNKITSCKLTVIWDSFTIFYFYYFSLAAPM